MHPNKKSGSLRAYLLTLISLVAVIALIGAFGFYHFERDAKPDRPITFADSVWWTLVTMTTIGYGDIFPVTAGGRLVAVVLMFVGIGLLGVSTAAIAAYFVQSDQLQQLRLHRLAGHVVLCGLGDKGVRLARAFQARGQVVVVIERNESNGELEFCRAQGMIVLLGDATDPSLLARARVGTARHLIAVCGDDGANAEVATHARALCEHRTGSALICSAHIVDPELWYLLRNWELTTVGAFRLQFFNVYDLGARAMLASHPPFGERVGDDAAAPHLLVVGGGRLGQDVILHAARLWRARAGTADRKLRVTLIDARTDHLAESLAFHHPGLDRVCQVDTHEMDVRSARFQQAAFLFDERGHTSVTSIYVCVDDDGAALSAALSLLHRIRHRRVPVVVRMTDDAGLATLLHGASGHARGFDDLYAVGLLERTCQPDLVLGGANETLARAIHEIYVDSQRREGHENAENPALVPWDRLPEDLKESNRSQADHIGQKLQAIGCDLAPLTEWAASAFALADDEIETMARMEHERWMRERHAQGWTLGPRDPQRKTNPNLVEWDALPESGRAFNRDAIRQLPESLFHAGFQIYRIRPSQEKRPHA